jgi:hypothetical protein
VSKHKSKTNVKVISSSGVSWTSKHGARRLMERGLAEMVAGELRVNESDPRFCCETQGARRPTPQGAAIPALLAELRSLRHAA